MSQQSYAPTMAPAHASSKQDEERSTKGTSKMLLRLTSAKRAASKFKNALQRKHLNGRSVVETTTPMLPAIQVSIASKENISALLAQVDASCDAAPRSDRRSRKANNRRATVYATYYGDESQEIPSPAPVRAASPATGPSIMSAMDDVLNQHISSWSFLDAPTPAAQPDSLMAVIEGILSGRDSESAPEKSGPRAAPAQLATPPATPVLAALPAAAISAVRPLRVVKKKPSALCLRSTYQEHLLPTPPATPLPEPYSSLPGSTDAPTRGERVGEAIASLSLLAKIERMEKTFEKGMIGRRQQWAEWDAQVSTIMSAFEPIPTSASLETIKPARASFVFEDVAAPIVDAEDDTDFYMCLCPLGRASTAEEKTARRTAHVVHYLVHPPEDFRCDRAYHALLRRWGHLVPELPAGSPVPEEFFRSLLA